MREPSSYLFHGNQQAPKHPHARAHSQPEPYVAEPELIEAVNLAIMLRHPLLVEGEAGCGKTRLAYAVAYELGLPLYRWNVRSTSKVQEGLYTYDYVLRLHDAQLLQAMKDDSILHDPRQPENYLTYGALGKALQMQGSPAVVLIDEIDKADRDFPNDLLGVLEEWAFEIHEIDRRISASEPVWPIVIITSNQEQGKLPDPFLRRCIYHYIEFPNDPERLKKVVDAHYATNPAALPPTNLTRSAIDRFLGLRREVLQKKPGTSELLDWLQALHHGHADPMRAPLPYPGLLLKLSDDWRGYGHPND